MCVCQAIVLLLVDFYNHDPRQHKLEKLNISIPTAVSFFQTFWQPLRVLGTHVYLLCNSFASEDFWWNCSERDD